MSKWKWKNIVSINIYIYNVLYSVKGKTLDVFLNEVKMEFPNFVSKFGNSYRDKIKRERMDDSASFGDIYGDNNEMEDVD